MSDQYSIQSWPFGKDDALISQHGVEAARAGELQTSDRPEVSLTATGKLHFVDLASQAKVKV